MAGNQKVPGSIPALLKANIFLFFCLFLKHLYAYLTGLASLTGINDPFLGFFLLKDYIVGVPPRELEQSLNRA